MSNEKFTPGEWKAIDETIWLTDSTGLDGMIADFRFIPSLDEQTANATLAAAAPDMYEALKNFIEFERDPEYHGLMPVFLRPFIASFKAALKKANP